MSDDFLSDARTAWRAEQPDIAPIRLRLRRRQRALQLHLALELIGGSLGFLIGLLFFALAVRTHELLFVLSAIALLVAMPLTMTANVEALRPRFRWEDQTPEDVVAAARHFAEASLRTVRIGRWGVLVIAGFVVFLWLAQASGAVHATGFLTLYTVTALLTCTPYLLILRRRHRRAIRECLACDAVAAELGCVNIEPRSDPSH